MTSSKMHYEPTPPSIFARRDLFVARNPDDADEISRLRREVVTARRHHVVDQLALEDAADRTEFVVRHTLIYRVGSIVQHYSKERVGRFLEKRSSKSYPSGLPPYPVGLPEQYSRWFTLARRQRWNQPARWVDDTVALIVVGIEGSAETIESFNVQRRTTDVVVTLASGAELPGALTSISAKSRPVPRWLMVLDAGDRLTPDAISLLIKFAGDGDVAYADQDAVDPTGSHVDPWLKGDDLGVFGPLSHFAFGGAAIYRRSALSEIDEELASAVLVDSVNRLVERGGVASHVPTVLLSRAAGRTSYIDDGDLARCTTAALARRGWGGSGQPGRFPGTVEWRPGDPVTWPSVQIVIPTRDRMDLLRRCVESIESRTDYPAYSITLVDNDSRGSDTLAYLTASSHHVIRAPGAFHFPRIINAGAAAGHEDFVLLLNNDTEVIDGRWLRDLVRMAHLPTVGVVGTVLVGQDGEANHLGMTVSGRPSPLLFPATAPGDVAALHATRDVIAVTGACQLIRRDIWDALGGHDTTFEVECSDVDISLRARALGYRTLLVATAPLMHIEKATRGEIDDDHDGPAFAYRWGLDDGFVDPHWTSLVTFWPGPRFHLPALEGVE